jgi:glyoxylase-like metal-dependent hydrolase (beta-lactamase superfamily II)
MTCAAVVGALCLVQAQAPAGQGAAPAAQGAQQGAPPAGGGGGRAPAPFKTNVLKEGRVYWVEGGGGNSGVIIGQTGVIVIDAKTTPDGAKQLIAEVAKLTPKPITNVILTHSDGDHVNGLPAFPAGINIIAHVNNRAEQRATFLYGAVEENGGRCMPPADRLPTQVVVKDKVATKIDGVNIVFYHFGPAHTSGDLVVYLPDDKIAFAGDLITNNVLVHTEKNGSLDGWFVNAKGLMALKADSYVGGHANMVDTVATLQKRMDDYQAQRDKVEGLMKEGKPLPDIKTAMGDPARNASGCRGIPYLSFAEVAYHTQNDKLQEVK